MKRERRRKKRLKIPAIDAVASDRRVRDARRRRGWRQIDLAHTSGIDKAVIGAWENGTRLPSRATLVALSVALRRSMDFLIFGKRGRKRIADPEQGGAVARQRRRRPAGSG